MNRLAEAQITSLMPLRKPLAKWSIRFTFGAGIVVLILDFLGRTPSLEVLAFLERIIDVTTVPVVGYMLTSTVEAVAKTWKGKEAERDADEHEDGHEGPGDDSYRRHPRGGSVVYPPAASEAGRYPGHGGDLRETY